VPQANAVNHLNPQTTPKLPTEPQTLIAAVTNRDQGAPISRCRGITWEVWGLARRMAPIDEEAPWRGGNLRLKLWLEGRRIW
jgi:hypothetical protein